MNDSIPACGGNQLNSAHTGSDYIQLRSKVGTLGVGDATKTIMHEIGHSLGLDNCTGSCYDGPSIMCALAPLNTCLSTRTSIDPSDIGQSNRNLSNSSSCSSIIQGQKLEDTGSCPSNNGCSGYDDNGYPIWNPDPCQYDYSCPSGWSLQTVNADTGAITCCVADWSPILIDVSRAGFELTSAEGGVSFDLDDSGTKHKFSWTASGVQNGWLALDRNGNGKIDSGAELFGNYTSQLPSADPNGFRALAVYDRPDAGGNGNGKIDSGDAIFKSLLIWIDANHNGVSEPDELHSLDEFNIKSISLSYQLSKWTDEYGNVFRYKAKIEIADDPSDHWTYDVLLIRAR